MATWVPLFKPVFTSGGAQSLSSRWTKHKTDALFYRDRGGGHDQYIFLGLEGDVCRGGEIGNHSLIKL
jgi:hypothetical protein